MVERFGASLEFGGGPGGGGGGLFVPANRGLVFPFGDWAGQSVWRSLFR